MRKKKKEYLPELTEEEKLDRNIKRKPILIKKLKHDAIIKVVAFAAAFFITFTFIFGVTRAETNDMYPAIHEGDVILYFRLGELINSDVAVFETKDENGNVVQNIARVQATEGASLGKTEGGEITINGNFQPIQTESGLFFKTYVGSKNLDGVVGENQYLLLGDQREYAKDSRTYGLINREDIKGKVFSILRRRPL